MSDEFEYDEDSPEMLSDEDLTALREAPVDVVVCNHLYTVSTQRLEPFGGPRIPRLEEDEFNIILATTLSWLPRLPVPSQPQEH